MSDNPDYQTSMSTIQSSPGTRLILNSLLHACHSTVTEWVIEVVTEVFRHEIIKASGIEMGLHLKTSQIHSLDLMNFNLQHISRKLEYVAPIHALLDAKLNAQFQWKENIVKDDSWDTEEINDI